MMKQKAAKAESGTTRQSIAAVVTRTSQNRGLWSVVATADFVDIVIRTCGRHAMRFNPPAPFLHKSWPQEMDKREEYYGGKSVDQQAIPAHDDKLFHLDPSVGFRVYRHLPPLTRSVA